MFFFYSLCVFIGWLIGAFLKIAFFINKKYLLAALILCIFYFIISSATLLFFKISQAKKGVAFSFWATFLGWLLLFIGSIGAGFKTPVS